MVKNYSSFDLKECSSVIYYFEKDGKTYWSFTNPVSFVNEKLADFAPHVEQIEQAGWLPQGVTKWAYIHSHWGPYGGDWGQKDLNVKGAENLRLYLINTPGDLLALRVWDASAGNANAKSRKIATGFRNSDKIKLTEFFWGDEESLKPIGNFWD